MHSFNELKKFNPSRLNRSSSICIIGKRGSGRTTKIKSLISQIKRSFDQCFLYSMCDYTKHEYCDTLDNKMILVASDSNANAQEVAYLHIEALINQIEERSRSGRKIVKKTLLIFDGFFSGSSFNKVPVLKKLFLSSRRLNITIISSIDRFFQLPPCIRSSVDYLMFVGTMNHQEVVFEEMIESGIRGFSGKCMIDENDLFPAFRESTKDSIKSTLELAKNFHNSANGRIKYGFAPRFVLSCSEELMIETSNLMKDFNGSLYHTHSSENKNEIEEVKKRYQKENIEYLNSISALHDHTVLAHCVHVNEEEIHLLKNKDARVAHCPSSNLKLGSGIANIPRYLKEGISVSLGADGAPCNNNLNAFVEMRLASLIQKPIHGASAMDAETTFRMATIEGAKALHLQNKTGSIEAGKKADLVFLNLKEYDQPLNEENVYSKIVYSASKQNVVHVMSEGEWIVKDGTSLIYNNEELYKKGKAELRELLKRVEEQ